MEFREGVKLVSNIDLGWTEDDFNNFLIDCHLLMKGQDESPQAIPLPLLSPKNVIDFKVMKMLEPLVFGVVILYLKNG